MEMENKMTAEQINKTEKMTGARMFLECLRREGVDKVFGYPGGVILHIYDELYKCDFIKHYLVRHEQAAVHAAEGYARITGKPGVVLVTSGPGACNTITGIANAYYDSYPLVVFTGQVDSKLIGNDAFQESDIVGITRTCCKHNYLVKNIADLPRVIKESFHIARTGRPGPVVVSLPKDVLTSKMEFQYPEKINLPGYNPTYEGHPIQCRKALKLLCEAQRPVIISGGGVIHSEGWNEIRALAKKLNIPIATTLMGIGTYPQDDELSLGMLGMHGNYWANLAVSNCDVLFAVGTRFNDRITGCLKRFCKDAKVIHIDIDPCSISKNVHVDIPIVGDAKNVLNLMLQDFDSGKYTYNIDMRKAWIHQIDSWKMNKAIRAVENGIMSPQTVIEHIYEKTKGKDAIIATEVGQHQMWTAQLYKFTKPRQLITSGGLGTMGFGFPAAIGAQIAAPDRLVFNVAGDGSIQMNIQELMTCVDYKIPVKIAIINNGYLGMVRQWQEKLFNKHYSQTPITSPDYVKLAEAYGVLGMRITKESEIDEALEKAMAYNGPVIMDFIVEPFEMVYPWILPGKPLNEVLLSNSEMGE